MCLISLHPALLQAPSKSSLEGAAGHGLPQGLHTSSQMSLVPPPPPLSSWAPQSLPSALRGPSMEAGWGLAHPSDPVCSLHQMGQAPDSHCPPASVRWITGDDSLSSIVLGHLSKGLTEEKGSSHVCDASAQSCAGSCQWGLAPGIEEAKKGKGQCMHAGAGCLEPGPSLTGQDIARVWAQLESCFWDRSSWRRQAASTQHMHQCYPGLLFPLLSSQPGWCWCQVPALPCSHHGKCLQPLPAQCRLSQ